MENNLNITQPTYIKNFFSAAFADFKKHWKLLVLIQLGFLVVQLITRIETNSLYIGIIQFIMSIGVTYLGFGFISLLLKIVRGQEVAIEDLWKNVSGKQFLKLIGAGIVAGLMMLGGFALLFVPGVILSLALHFTSYALIDDDMPIWQSLMYSMRITKGYRLKMLVLALLLLIPFFAGIILGSIPFIGPILFMLIIVGPMFFAVFIYPLVFSRVYVELKELKAETLGEQNIKPERTLGIVSLVLGPIFIVVIGFAVMFGLVANTVYDYRNEEYDALSSFGEVLLDEDTNSVDVSDFVPIDETLPVEIIDPEVAPE